MVPHGALAHEQRVCDGWHSVATEKSAEDLPLAAREITELRIVANRWRYVELAQDSSRPHLCCDVTEAQLEFRDSLMPIESRGVWNGNQCECGSPPGSMKKGRDEHANIDEGPV